MVAILRDNEKWRRATLLVQVQLWHVRTRLGFGRARAQYAVGHIQAAADPEPPSAKTAKQIILV